MILVAIDPGNRTGYVKLDVCVETQVVKVVDMGTVQIHDIVQFKNSVLPEYLDEANIVCYETWIQLTNAATGSIVNEIIGAVKLFANPNAVVKGQIPSTRLICIKPLNLKTYSHDPDDISAFKHAMSYLLINKFLDPDKVSFEHSNRSERAFAK
jgi:hypothetical protein